MTTYPHTRSQFSGPLFSLCRCGASAVCWPDTTAVAPAEWGAGCPAAMRERIAELEAHEASLHKHASRAVGAVVRWLRAMAEEGGDPWMSYCADAIERGEHAEWCEAHPEPTDPR